MSGALLGATAADEWERSEGGKGGEERGINSPHGEVLRKTHEGVVDSRVPVRVVLAQDFTDHAGTLAEGLVGCHAEIVHGKEDTPVHGLETCGEPEGGGVE